MQFENSISMIQNTNVVIILCNLTLVQDILEKERGHTVFYKQYNASCTYVNEGSFYIIITYLFINQRDNEGK